MRAGPDLRPPVTVGSLARTGARFSLIVALAQVCVPAGAAGESTRDLPYQEAEPVPRAPLALPEPMPVRRAFDDLMAFAIDADTPNRYGLDPASIRFQPPFVMVALGVRSPSGALTQGYYGFDCATGQYRLIALPSGADGWQAASARSPWRLARGNDGRNRQYLTVYRATCRLGGLPAQSVDDVLQVLREGPAYTGN